MVTSMSGALLAILLHLARVVRVIDGDTLVVQTLSSTEKVRLLGIDCPETHVNQKCRSEGTCWDRERGLAAAEFAGRLLPTGAVVVIDTRGRRDRYSRLLAYVFVDGTDVGRYLLSLGLCDEVSSKYPHARQRAYRLVAPMGTQP
jgi:micrococcal nuclease